MRSVRMSQSIWHRRNHLEEPNGCRSLIMRAIMEDGDPQRRSQVATEKALREQEDCDLNALEEGIENTHGELIAENRKSRVSRRGQG